MAFEDLSLSDLRVVALGYEGDTPFSNRYGSIADKWINYAQQLMVGELGIEDIWTSVTQPTVRNYPAPPGWTRFKTVLFNGTPLRFCAQIDQDFFDAGTTYCDRYSIWKNQIWLGALPPNAAFPLVSYFYRAPHQLVADADKPEVPNRFRQALADYAGAKQVLASSGDMAIYGALMKSFTDARQEYFDWVTAQSTEHIQVRNVTDGWTLWRR